MDYREGRFEWDRAKAARNLADHKVSFEAARLAFDDPNALDEFLPDDSGYEDRFRKLVLGGVGLLVVIDTEREGADAVTRVRIISAWKANKHDQARYEAG